jgi:hypothetical protein
MKKFCLYTFLFASLTSDSLQVPCFSNGRQTSSIHFINPSSNAHLFVAPPSQGATRDSGLYYNDITVEIFVNLTSNPSPNAFHPLIGNMEASFSSNMGVASGWRLACRQTTCCFQAFIGYRWNSRSAVFDTQFLDDRRTRSFQQVCTVQPVPTSKWFHLAATYSSSNGLATIFVNGVVQAQRSFVAVGDPDFGFDSSLQINYDYTYDLQVILLRRTASEIVCIRLSLPGSPSVCCRRSYRCQPPHPAHPTTTPRSSISALRRPQPLLPSLPAAVDEERIRVVLSGAAADRRLQHQLQPRRGRRPGLLPLPRRNRRGAGERRQAGQAFGRFF